MRRDAYGLLVTVALVVLSLNLASAALTAMTDGDELARSGGAQAPEGASGYLEATLVHTDLRSAGQGEGDQAEDRCVAARSVRTTYRPVLLLNRSETGCGAHERVDLTLHIQAEPPVELLSRSMALCHLDAYRLVQAPSGPMIGPKGEADCRRLDLPPLVPGPTQRVRVDGHVAEEAVTEPGLYVVCSVAEIRSADGPRRSVADMTWFEAWELGGTAHHRDGHLQSQVADNPCQRLDLELPAGWPGSSEGPR